MPSMFFTSALSRACEAKRVARKLISSAKPNELIKILIIMLTILITILKKTSF